MKRLLRYRTVEKMMYRNSKEYNQPLNNPELESLRSWLRGETGTESLKQWLSSMYA